MFTKGLCYSSRPKLTKGLSMNVISCELNLTSRDWLRILMLLGEDSSEGKKIITILKKMKESSCLKDAVNAGLNS